MKAFLVVCLAVAAVAESDPQLLINPYVASSPLLRPLTYVKPVHYQTINPVEYKTVAQVKPVEYKTVAEIKPVEYKTVAEIKPVEYKTFSEVKPVQYVQPQFVKVEEYNLAKKIAEEKATHHVKVEAYNFENKEKKFEIPALKYKSPVVGTVATHHNVAAFPYGAPVTTYSTGVVGTQEHIVPAKYHSKNGEVEHTVFKREAEAFYPSYPYAASTYAAYPHTVYNTAAAYHYPAGVYSHPFVPSTVKTYANDAIKPEQYAAKNQYVAQSAGAIHIAKREAEAESFYPYSAYTAGVYPTVYNTPAYTTYGAHPYTTTPYYGNVAGYRYFY